MPEGTRSLALVVQDIDAPDPSSPIVPWTCWVVANIPPHLKGLPEGFSGKGEELGGDHAEIQEGNNDHKVPGWRGPKLPSHGHRFEFKLYALDEKLNLGHKVCVWHSPLSNGVQSHHLYVYGKWRESYCVLVIFR